MESKWYLLQVSLSVMVFYGLYLAFFRSMTLFIFNRIYLLGCLFLSFVIPLLNIQFVASDFHVEATDFISGPSLHSVNSATKSIVAAATTSIDFPIFSIIYWIGFLFFISRLIYFALTIVSLKNRSEISESGTIEIIHADIRQPFSFFNKVFLPTYGIESLVLEHEKAHVHQRHWIDLLLVEIATALLWFNPVMILYRRSVKIQHEYEADAFAVGGTDIECYFNCMLNYLQAENSIGPISPFYSQTIKQRILMMTRKKTNLKFSLLYTLTIPVVCLLLFAFSTPSIRNITFDNRVTPDKDGQIVIVIDAGHGGTDSGALNSEGMNEGEFVLAVAKQVQKSGEAKNIKVILTRTGDEALSLEERVLISNRHQANAFISLHANNDPKSALTSGIACLISEKNNKFEESKRLAEKVIHEFQTLEGISVTGSKKSDFYVLSKNTNPAVILELGFLSNKADQLYLSDERNQKQISEKIINAVIAFTK